MGLTATAEWPDGRTIEDLWGRKIHQLTLKEGILKSMNAAPLFYLFEANLVESDLKIYNGDYIKKNLGAGMKAAEIHKAIPDIYKTLIPRNERKNYPTIIFVPSTELVQRVIASMRNTYASEGLTINGWTGDTTTSDMLKKDVEAFNNGELDVLVLCEMGGRGLNLPRARCLIDGYPTLSANKLEQRHGRVLRKIHPESIDAKRGYEKPFSLIAQIIPESNTYKPSKVLELIRPLRVK